MPPLPQADDQRPDRCETCRFFDQSCHSDRHDEGSGEASGHCRRFPPIINPAFLSYDRLTEEGDYKKLGAIEPSHTHAAWEFPTVVPSDWCGEWQAKPAPPRPLPPPLPPAVPPRPMTPPTRQVPPRPARG